MDWTKVRWDPVNIGATRRDNHYPGCTCPPWRYHPASGPRPTNPTCREHGTLEGKEHG